MMEGNNDDLVYQVVKKIGVNIIIFQEIEQRLKFILPYLSKPNDSPKSTEEIIKQKEVVKSQTLGNLINQYLKSIDIKLETIESDGTRIKNDSLNSDLLPNFQKIVEQRNKLVHCLDRFIDLNSEQGCRETLIRLEGQRQEAYDFLQMIQPHILAMLYMEKKYGKPNQKVDLLYEKLKADIIKNRGDNFEYINEDDPSETAWENTKIVKLLRLAEIETEKVENMTLLSRAGDFIKQVAPEYTAKKYGVKTLKELLKVSGLFEIIEKERRILYKSINVF